MTKEELEKQTMEWKNNYILKLEKRCANYEMKISKMEKGTCDICKESEKDKRLAELEKENAELKSTNKSLLESCEGATMMYEHLNKAKEIIKEYMRFEPMIGTCSFYSEEYEKTKAKAEAFLKECKNEEYFKQIRNLCKACGLAIDKIAKQFNIKQNLVAKLFMEMMQTILDKNGQMIKVGDKVKFNDNAKRKFNRWLNDKGYCGRENFCKALKKFDLNGWFSVADVDSESVTLVEMPDWYFELSEFVK